MSFMPADEIEWLSTGAAAKSLGITTRTLYRFIDQGEVPAHRFGRVIRLERTDIGAFVENSRIEPGTLEHLYPESVDQADRGRQMSWPSRGARVAFVDIAL